MGGLFRSGRFANKEVAKPTAPIADEEILKRKRKENIRKQQRRTGRQSTILSERAE